MVARGEVDKLCLGESTEIAHWVKLFSILLDDWLCFTHDGKVMDMAPSPLEIDPVRKDYRSILRRAGIILLVIGVSAFGLTTWLILSSASSILENIHAFGIWPLLVIALVWLVWGTFFLTPGILIFRGGLRAAKYLRYLALIALGWYVIDFLQMPFQAPVDFYLVLLKLAPREIVTWILVRIPFIAFFFWLQLQLGRIEIRDAQMHARINPAATFPAFLIGCACQLVLLGVAYFMMHGDAGRQAVERAEADHGTQYKYFVTHITYSRESSNGFPSEHLITANVTGYYPEGIQTFTERWSEPSPEQGK